MPRLTLNAREVGNRQAQFLVHEGELVTRKVDDGPVGLSLPVCPCVVRQLKPVCCVDRVWRDILALQVREHLPLAVAGHLIE